MAFQVRLKKTAFIQKLHGFIILEDFWVCHSGHFYVRGVTPSVASKANDGEKSVFIKKGPKYSLGFML